MLVRSRLAHPLRRSIKRAAVVAILGVLLFPAIAEAGRLDDELGRSEVRVYAESYPLPVGRTVVEAALPERLQRLGYRRVRGHRPRREGEYFWGHELFWIYRHAHRYGGRKLPAELVGVRLSRGDSRILGPADPTRAAASQAGAERERPRREMPRLEPELLAESLAADRAPRRPIRIDDLPDHLWQPLLAIEDGRFFDHPGVDYRGVARALLANVRAGKVRQGGSTITQQLVKMRDLTPKRSLGRKASEALRALALEAEYDKREILESYLNHVYYGQIDGVAIHGLGAAAWAFFSRPAAKLDLAQAALLAGVIQSPNRLSPLRHPQRALARRNQVLDRMAELEWASEKAVTWARGRDLELKIHRPPRRTARHFLSWVAATVEQLARRRSAKKRGVVVETHLDPYLQELAEEAVMRRLDRLRRGSKRLRSAPLSAALVVLDGETGAVRAYVGGDPRWARSGFDRARSARRQPGSTVKPLVLLEAFDRCRQGGSPLTPASRVVDAALRLELPAGPWQPSNFDRRFRGVVDLRTALADSLNIPFVRVARWCGFEATAGRLRRAGLDLPRDPPPSFVLGALELSPLELARAYTVFHTPGAVVTPLPVARLLTPGGRGLKRLRPRRKRVVRPATAYLVRDLMRQAVDSGTARAAKIEGWDVAGKTGSSSRLRDAWFAGQAGSLVAVAWVGLDNGEPLGLTGSAAAAPLWKAFMERAVPTRQGRRLARPEAVVERRVDPATGLLVRAWSKGRMELFRRGALPPRDRLFRHDRPVEVVQ